MKTEYMKTYIREHGAWKCEWETDDPAEVHERLMHDLIAKKLHKCSYITSIKDYPNHKDDTRTITVFHDNDCKTEYRVIF